MRLFALTGPENVLPTARPVAARVQTERRFAYIHLKTHIATLAKRGSGPLNERRTSALAFAKIAWPIQIP